MAEKKADAATATTAPVPPSATDDFDPSLCALFQKQLPPDWDKRTDFTGLQALKYQTDNPVANAEHYKDEANDILKKKGKQGWHEAISLYTDAIEVGSPSKENNSIYYSNRAHVNLLLENYLRALNDANKAIELNPHNTKAHYRVVRALFGLKRFPEASQACEVALREEELAAAAPPPVAADPAAATSTSTTPAPAPARPVPAPEGPVATPAAISATISKVSVTAAAPVAPAGPTAAPRVDGRPALRELQAKIAAALAAEREREQRRLDEIRKAQREKEVLSLLLRKRGLRVGAPLPQVASLQEDCRTTVRAVAEKAYTSEQDATATASQLSEVVHYVLHWPALILYPEHNQTDLVEDFPENVTLGEQLASLIPIDKEGTAGAPFPSWDERHLCSLDQVAVYYQTNWTSPVIPGRPNPTTPPAGRKDWIRVPLDKTLLEIQASRTYVTPKFPVFYVLNRASPFHDVFLNSS
ncbi:putative tetratricopeptide repeat domain 4 [Paratrimastix pyriformis]|uniref:Tetratricopeptide repeat domain 4 n=1 Tax=Paratrimastix pyriformis TaxID=342808 RepID=A0ABQ8UM97_9EUKA|nr:putative tetratricopeptide repeat domain 4 [Paratrimastix pyriformis]